MPSFNLNIAVDTLLKREFDIHRQAKSVHPLLKKYKIDAIPFTHHDLDTWRDAFLGLEYKDTTTNLVVSGAIDDIWQKHDGTLMVVDYKATSKEGHIETLADSSWEASYARQMGVYQWLLRQNGFTVSDTGYFVYTNGKKDKEGFFDTLHFETTLIPCAGDTTWILPTLKKIKTVLEAETYPPSGANCEYCPYREACGKKLLALKPL